MPILTSLTASPLPAQPVTTPSSIPLHPQLAAKSLNFQYSFIFIINQIYGPGVLAIPILFQQSGLVLSGVFLVAFCVISSLSSTLLSQAIALIPGNARYDRRFEFSSCIRYYWPRSLHGLSSVLLNITIQSYNLASIVICAQSIDQAIIELFGRTFALTLYPHAAFTAVSQQAFDGLTNGSFSLTVTLGYLLVVVIFMPTCFQNLDDNVKTVQLLSFVCFVVILAEFTGYFVWQGHRPVSAGGGFHPVPWVGGTYTQLVSVFIFSWSYTMFVPSWLNEKRDGVSVNAVIWSAGIVALLGYLLFGLLCASVEAGIVLDNILPLLAQDAPILTRIFAHAFALTIIAPGIPVCAVSTRNNLLVSRLFSLRVCYFLSAVLPFLLSFIFSSGTFFANLLVWSSLLFNGIVNFLIPFALYVTAVRRWERRKLRRSKKKQQQQQWQHRQEADLDENGVHGDWYDAAASPTSAVDGAEGQLSFEGAAAEGQSSNDSDAEDMDWEDAEDDDDADADGQEDELGRESSAHIEHAAVAHTSAPFSLNESGGEALSSSLLRSSSAVSATSSTASFVHLPSARTRHSPVNPYGSIGLLRRYAVHLTVAAAAITATLIVGQIVLDLYYLIGLNENLLK